MSVRYFFRCLDGDLSRYEAQGWTESNRDGLPIRIQIPSLAEPIVVLERAMPHPVDGPPCECAMCKKVDAVNHPAHYTSGAAKCKCGRTIECIDVTRYMTFNLGNVFKYIWRCDLKYSDIEDLKKAAWYLADEIERRKAKE